MTFVFLFLSLNAYSLDLKTVPDFSSQLKGYDFHSFQDKKSYIIMKFINENKTGKDQCYCLDITEKGGKLLLHGAAESKAITETDFYSCGPCKED